MRRSTFAIGSALAGAALLLAGQARAALGGPLVSVEADRSRMAAHIVSAPMGGYTRHTLMRANGGSVREFTNADGEVFAVTWSGPGKPDLRALLGGRFATFQAASGATGRAAHTRRRPAQVDQPDLQIQTAGHMGWFSGVAFIPSLAPPGFSTSDLPVEQ